MSKYVTYLISICLLPSLIADPSLAAGLSQQSFPGHLNTFVNPIFSQEALAGEPEVAPLHEILGPVVSATVRTAAAVMIALPAFAQSLRPQPPLAGQIRQYLEGLATQWLDSGDSRKIAWAPYVQDMSKRLNLLPGNATFTPLGVQPFAHEDGSYIINPATRRIEFRLNVSPTIWSTLFSQLASSHGRERQLLERAFETYIEKEIGTLLSFQEHSAAGRNLEALERWIAANASSPDALTMEDLRNDPAMREAIKIYAATFFRGETAGYILQADEIFREGPALSELDNLIRSRSWPPLIARLLESTSNWASTLAPSFSHRFWRAVPFEVNGWLAHEAQSALVSPEQLFASRKALLIEVVEGRATLNANRMIEVPENPNANGFTPRFMSYLEDPAYYTPSTEAMLARLEALRRRYPRKAQTGTVQTASAENPRGIVFVNLTAPETAPQVAPKTPAAATAPKVEGPTFWGQWKTVLLSIGGIFVTAGGIVVFVLWKRSQRIRAEEAVEDTLTGGALEQWHERTDAFRSQIGKGLVAIVSSQGRISDLAKKVEDLFSRAHFQINRETARRIVEKLLGKPRNPNQTGPGRRAFLIGSMGVGASRYLRSGKTYAIAAAYVIHRLLSGPERRHSRILPVEA